MNVSGTYDVCLEGKVIGWVKLATVGLYCVLESQCCWAGETMMHLSMAAGDFVEDMGLMIPIDGKLHLRKKIPLKRIEGKILSFSLRPRQSDAEIFIPVDPDLPFPFLHCLGDARLEFQDNTAGIVILKNS